MTRFRPWFIAALLALAGGAATAQDGPLPFLETRDGMRWTVRIERSVETVRDGTSARTWRVEAEYAASLARTMDRGNVVTWAPARVRADPAPPGEHLALASGAEIVWRADSSLSPTRVENWDALRAAMTRVAAPDVDLSAATPQTAATFLLRDAALIALPQDMPVEAGKPLELDDRAPSPLGGAAIPAKMRFEPPETRGDRVVLRWSRTLDEAALAALADELERRSPDAPGDVSLEREDRCTFEMDGANGMTRVADCVTAVRVTGGATAGARTERVSIVQTPAF